MTVRVGWSQWQTMPEQAHADHAAGRNPDAHATWERHTLEVGTLNEATAMADDLRNAGAHSVTITVVPDRLRP